MGDRHHSILKARIILPQTMPMYTSFILSLIEFVGHMDNDCVSPVGVECRPGDGTVYYHRRAFKAIRGSGKLVDDQPIFSGNISLGDQLALIRINIIFPTPCSSIMGRVAAAGLV